MGKRVLVTEATVFGRVSYIEAAAANWPTEAAFDEAEKRLRLAAEVERLKAGEDAEIEWIRYPYRGPTVDTFATVFARASIRKSDGTLHEIDAQQPDWS